MKGLFIVFEGGEGSGKTTQARLLSEALTSFGVENTITREPGDTPLGADIRKILLDRDRAPMTKMAEALLFAADRAEHVENVIKPVLHAGGVVICDRYIASTIAYQGYANGLDRAVLWEINRWTSSWIDPDVTFFLDVDPVVGLERAMRVKRTRFEDKDVSYHQKVRRGFLAQMEHDREISLNHWVHVDGHQKPAKVHELILNLATGLCRSLGYLPLGWLPPYSREKPTYIYKCPECGEILHEHLMEINHYLCVNGHGEIFMPDPGDPRPGIYTFTKEVVFTRVEEAKPC